MSRVVEPALASVGKRAVEVDGEVRAVAERLVPGLAAAAQGHLVRVRDFPAVDIGQAYRPGYQVGAILAGGDRDVRHRRCPNESYRVRHTADSVPGSRRQVS